MTNRSLKGFSASLLRATAIIALPVASILSITPVLAQEAEGAIVFRYTPNVLAGGAAAPPEENLFEFEVISSEFLDNDNDGYLTTGDQVRITVSGTNYGTATAILAAQSPATSVVCNTPLPAGATGSCSILVPFKSLEPTVFADTIRGALMDMRFQPMAADNEAVSISVPDWPDGYTPPVPALAMPWTAPAASYIDIDGDSYKSFGDQIRVSTSITNSQDRILVFRGSSNPYGQCEVVVGPGETQPCEILIDSGNWWYLNGASEIGLSGQTWDPEMDDSPAGDYKTTLLTIPGEKPPEGYLAAGAWSSQHNDSNGNGFHDVGETLSISQEIENSGRGPVSNLTASVSATVYDVDPSTLIRTTLHSASISLTCDTDTLEANASTACHATIPMTAEWLAFNDNKSVNFGFIPEADGTNNSASSLNIREIVIYPDKAPETLEVALSNGWKITCGSKFTASAVQSQFDAGGAGEFQFEFTNDQDWKIHKRWQRGDNTFAITPLFSMDSSGLFSMTLCYPGSDTIVEGIKENSAGLTASWRWL